MKIVFGVELNCTTLWGNPYVLYQKDDVKIYERGSMMNHYM